MHTVSGCPSIRPSRSTIEYCAKTGILAASDSPNTLVSSSQTPSNGIAHNAGLQCDIENDLSELFAKFDWRRGKRRRL